MKESRLKLIINGETLGWLGKSSNRGLDLQYSPFWIKHHPQRPISRNFPVQEAVFRGEKVRNYFDNLLPDSDSVLNRLAAIHSLKNADTFNLLSVIGKDCVGALQFMGEDETPTKKLPAKEPISNTQIADLLKQLKTQPLGQHREDEYFRISIAGAQDKTALLKFRGRWYKPIGSTPTTHILKPQVDLDFGGTPVPITSENEWLCLKICGLFGLSTAHAEIEMFDGIKVLSVERFDRKWNSSRRNFDRIIQEDFCQATGTPPHLKYESRGGPGMKQILDILNESVDPKQDRYHFFKSQIIFWLLAAIDGHAKNFSLQWSDKGAALTPLYDVISASPLVAAKKLPEQKIGLDMAVQGKNRHYRIREIKRRHWDETAKLTKIPESDVTRAFAEVLETGHQLRKRIAPLLPARFPSNTLEPILKGIEERLKLI